MLFHYSSLNDNGNKDEGDIDATSLDNAISLLNSKGITKLLEVKEKIDNQNDVFKAFTQSKLFKQAIKPKDIVLFSRQVATLFEAGVSALRAFRLLAQENENKTLQGRILEVADDIEGGVSLSDALAKCPDLFSNFYVNMVKA